MFPILAALAALATPSALIENPEWAQRPQGAEVARYYPERAQRRNVEGRALLLCQVAADGALTSCFVAEESPKEEAFGAALLRLSRVFRMKATDQDGSPTAGRWVKLPMAFHLPRAGGENAPDFIGAEACYGQVAELAEGDGGTAEVWRASLYWYSKIVQGVANNGGRPSQVEAYAADAREKAHEHKLSIPPGWDTQACLAKASGK